MGNGEWMRVGGLVLSGRALALNGWLSKRWVQLTSDNASEKFRQPKVQLTSDTSLDF